MPRTPRYRRLDNVTMSPITRCRLQWSTSAHVEDDHGKVLEGFLCVARTPWGAWWSRHRYLAQVNA